MQLTVVSISIFRRFALLGVLTAGFAACSNARAFGLSGDPDSIGDPSKGAALIEKLGCGSCHVIPGIINAHGMVGPPLNRMAGRQYIAGLLRNTPENMVRWLRFPQQIVPGNAMPNLGISDTDAHQISAYLSTLR